MPPREGPGAQREGLGAGRVHPGIPTINPMTPTPDSPSPDHPPSPPHAARRPAAYPAPVDHLIQELSRLPGIGRRSAERMAFHLLRADKPEAFRLAKAIRAVKESIAHCSICFNLTDRDPCPICADDRRDRRLVLVVEQPKDLIALEQTGMYDGLYHVLLGRLSPLDGIGPEDLTVQTLLGRIDRPEVNPGGISIEEVILGLNPTMEGDGTALYLGEAIRGRAVRISRLARGLPSGGQLEHANKAVLADAIHGRQPIREGSDTEH